MRTTINSKLFFKVYNAFVFIPTIAPLSFSFFPVNYCGIYEWNLIKSKRRMTQWMNSLDEYLQQTKSRLPVTSVVLLRHALLSIVLSLWFPAPWNSFHCYYYYYHSSIPAQLAFTYEGTTTKMHYYITTAVSSLVVWLVGGSS